MCQSKDTKDYELVRHQLNRHLQLIGSGVFTFQGRAYSTPHVAGREVAHVRCLGVDISNVELHATVITLDS